MPPEKRSYRIWKCRRYPGNILQKDRPGSGATETEVLKTSGAGEEEIQTAQERVDNLEMMAGAVGQVIYRVDKEGNLTDIESKMLMENGAGTGSVLHLEDFGQISFKGYTENP